MLKKRIILYPLLFIFIVFCVFAAYYAFFKPPKTYSATFVYNEITEKGDITGHLY